MSNAGFSQIRRRLLRSAALLALSAVVAPAWGGLRFIPPAARRAVMLPPQNGLVQLDDKLYRLSVGAQIRDSYNRIVVPAAVQQAVLVRYLADNRGDVFRVWVLTAEEAAQPDPVIVSPPAVSASSPEGAAPPVETSTPTFGR